MALDPRWMGPPEIVAAILEAGPGPASTIANQLVWIAETISHELSMGLSAVNTAATATAWTGLGGGASAVSATNLNAGLQTMVGWTTHKVSVVQAALDAYACARPAVIPSVVCQTNRDEWTVLNATNLLGQNTPAIIERDMEYFGEHWPHNSGVGLAYSGALSALSATLAVPPPAAPMGASPAAPASVGTAAAQAMANPADALGAPTQAAASSGEMTGPLSSVLQQGPQLVSTATEPLNSVGQASGQAFQSFSAMPQTMLGAFSSMRPTDIGAADVAAAEAVAEPWRAGAAGGLVAGPAGAGNVGVGGYPGAALTSFTRPASTFTPEEGGRPLGRAGVLDAAELRGPTTTLPMGGGAPVPVSSAGMLGRAGDHTDKDVARARIVVDDRTR